MKTLQLVYECWLEVTKQERYHHKWLTDETYFRAIKAQFPTVESLGFDRGKLNWALSTHGGAILDDFTESNCSGRFRRQASGYDPFGNPFRKVWGYYVTFPGGQVARPPSGDKSFLSLLQDKHIGDHYSVAHGVPEVVDLTSEIAEHKKWLANKTLKFLLEQDRSIAHLIPSTVYKNYLFLDLLPRVL